MKPATTVQSLLFDSPRRNLTEASNRCILFTALLLIKKRVFFSVGIDNRFIPLNPTDSLGSSDSIQYKIHSSGNISYVPNYKTFFPSVFRINVEKI